MGLRMKQSGAAAHWKAALGRQGTGEGRPRLPYSPFLLLTLVSCGVAAS